ncbi:MAG: hypothetical protein EOM34_00055 [Clostridia bacterium]|nr:hypothetical protein [Lachnospiraceae bacterium]NCB99058.1 hypothetical protein [Clostridia bacterium]NCD03508.1 hypothetical protein [Clostridia bacterium]
MNRDEVISALKELQADSKAFNEKQDPMGLFKKYGVFFLGEKYNLIFSHEILSILQKYYHMDVDIIEFTQELPAICDSLGMTYEPVAELFASAASCFEVALW